MKDEDVTTYRSAAGNFDDYLYAVSEDSNLEEEIPKVDIQK